MNPFQIVSSQDRVNFTKSLGVLLNSGVTINQALMDLSEQTDSPRFARVIVRVQKSIEEGNSLSKSFGKEEKVFGKIFVSLIKAGEQSGTLQNNLQFLAVWLGRSADLKREVSAATMYPKLVFGAAILLGGSLSMFILPKLVPLFTGLRVELPLPTKILLAMSLWTQEYWWLAIILIGIGVAVLMYLNTFYVIRRIFHKMYLNIPFVGSILKNYQSALMAQLFSVLLKSGLSLNEAIPIVAQSATSIPYQEALEKSLNNLAKSMPLSKSLSEFEALFPRLMVSIVSVGEQTGSMAQSFEYLSDFYTKEVNVQTKRLPTIIEPLLLVFIAIIVGFVAIAIIMPIYELSGNI